MFRIGFGYDVHPLVENRPLILGGLKIPHSLGLMGHSDADVLTHAIMDAILGALAMGDIGEHFPDDDPTYKNMESLVMLKRIMEWVRQGGYRVNNVDTTIVAEKPKLSPYFMAMREKLSVIMETGPEQINIKATTTEGLGFCGRKEGIEAFAVVGLVRFEAET